MSIRRLARRHKTTATRFVQRQYPVPEAVKQDARTTASGPRPEPSLRWYGLAVFVGALYPMFSCRTTRGDSQHGLQSIECAVF